MLRISVAAVMWGAACFGAETNGAKGLFIVRVEALRSVDGKAEVTKKDVATPAAMEQRDDFILETPRDDSSMELRAQQIEAMNGGTMLRRGGAAGAGAPRRIGRALDFLLPKSRPLLSNNPNARRDPLRVLEE